MIRIISFFCLAVGLFSCEKNINFNLDETAPVLVVDAEIEEGMEPRVVLTKSISYYAQIGPQVLENNFVHDAEVYISNAVTTHRMKEFSVPLFPGFNLYYYGIDPSSPSTRIVGELNTHYKLRIVSEGKEYVSETDVTPLSIPIDSFYFKPTPFSENPAQRSAFLKATDPRGLGNYVRYFTKTNAEPFFPGPNSVYSDEIIDGTTFTIQLEKGINRNNPPKINENFFISGDTVILKLCNINRATYTFWNTWEFAAQSIGNPFSQPNKVLGNVSNGALGAFCGYAVAYDTVIVR